MTQCVRESRSGNAWACECLCECECENVGVSDMFACIGTYYLIFSLSLYISH